MAQRYQNIMVAIDGSKEADLAFVKGVHSALRNDAKLTIAHVIDTRALQSVSTFDAEVYEEKKKELSELLQPVLGNDTQQSSSMGSAEAEDDDEDEDDDVIGEL